MLTVILGIVFASVGAVMFYLASPHQKLLAVAMPRRLLRALSILSLIGAGLLLVRIVGAGTAFFAVLTLLMVLWSIAPIFVALIRYQRTHP